MKVHHNTKKKESMLILADSTLCGCSLLYDTCTKQPFYFLVVLYFGMLVL